MEKQLEGDWVDPGLEFLYDWLCSSRYYFDDHYQYINLKIKTHLTPEDVLEFKNCKVGVFIVTPIVYPDRKVSYTIIHIDRVTRLIHCANTNGDHLNCETFNFLCNLNDNGHYFTCAQYNNRCERYHEFKVNEMLKILFGNSIDMVDDSSDKDMLEMLSMTNEIPGYNSNTVQPLNTYKKVLEKYPNINEDIRNSMMQHINKQSRETVAKKT